MLCCSILFLFSLYSLHIEGPIQLTMHIHCCFVKVPCCFWLDLIKSLLDIFTAPPEYTSLMLIQFFPNCLLRHCMLGHCFWLLSICQVCSAFNISRFYFLIVYKNELFLRRADYFTDNFHEFIWSWRTLFSYV